MPQVAVGFPVLKLAGVAGLPLASRFRSVFFTGCGGFHRFTKSQKCPAGGSGVAARPLRSGGPRGPLRCLHPRTVRHVAIDAAALTGDVDLGGEGHRPVDSLHQPDPIIGSAPGSWPVADA